MQHDLAGLLVASVGSSISSSMLTVVALKRDLQWLTHIVKRNQSENQHRLSKLESRVREAELELVKNDK